MGLITLGTSILVCILMKQDVASPNKAKSECSEYKYFFISEKRPKEKAIVI